MDYQSRYDELNNIVTSIDILVDEVSDKYYKDSFNLIKYEAQNELDEIAEKLEEQYDRENRQQEQEYWKEAI